MANDLREAKLWPTRPSLENLCILDGVEEDGVEMRSDGEGGRKERQKLPQAVDYQTCSDWLLKRLHDPCGACCGKPRSSANEYNGNFHPLGRCFTCWRGVLVYWECVSRWFVAYAVHFARYLSNGNSDGRTSPIEVYSAMASHGIVVHLTPRAALGNSKKLDWQRLAC